MVAALSTAVGAVFVAMAGARVARGVTGAIAFTTGMAIGAEGAMATCTLGVVTWCTTCSVGTGGGTTASGDCRMAAWSEMGIGAWTGNVAIGRSANNRIARFRLRVSAIASERVACGAHSKE